MQFNQTNKNGGDVNNAISENGNVVQTTGDGNRVEVGATKESFWATLWKKVKSIWSGIFG